MNYRWRLLAISGVLVAVAAVLAGCLGAPDDPDGAQLPKEWAPPGVPAAYFILQGADLRSPDWPSAWEGHDVFVCNPALEAAQIAQAKTDRPEATFLAYTSVADIHLGLFSANAYWAALEAVFDTTLCARDLVQDVVVRMGTMADPDFRIPYYVMQQQSADILVAFHRDVTMTSGYDGLYLDNCTKVVPWFRLDALFELAPSVDVDADDVPDDRARISSIYAQWRPYFTERLRAEVGEDRILIANAGGPLGDPALHGITLEGVGDRFEIADALEYFERQRDVGRTPFLGIGWATTPASRGACEYITSQMPGLYYGNIIQ